MPRHFGETLPVLHKSFHASGNTRSSQGGSTITNEFSLTLIPAGN